MNKAKLPLKLRSCCSVKTKTQKVAKVEKVEKKEKTERKKNTVENNCVWTISTIFLAFLDN